MSCKDSGTNLTLPRMIDFEHVFPNERCAQAFAETVRESVVEVRVSRYEGEGSAEDEWDVQCRLRMVPTHEAISSTEVTLAEQAAKFGGTADGWGSLSNADGTPAEVAKS
jgi:hypothetical protein